MLYSPRISQQTSKLPIPLIFRDKRFLHYTIAQQAIKPWYENGLIIAINETDGTLLNIVDIINKQLPPNIKKINHFMEIGGTAYVSCDLGLFNSTWRLCNLGILILLVTMVPKL
jgi:hypothetical protein